MTRRDFDGVSFHSTEPIASRRFRRLTNHARTGIHPSTHFSRNLLLVVYGDSMKAFIVLLFTVVACHASLIERLSLVESGDNDMARGRHGERSRWQIMGYVRRNYPNVVWSDPQAARRCVVQELNQRSAHFMGTHGKWPTPFQQAVLWHHPSYADHPTTSDTEYAQRVLNVKTQPR